MLYAVTPSLCSITTAPKRVREREKKKKEPPRNNESCETVKMNREEIGAF